MARADARGVTRPFSVAGFPHRDEAKTRLDLQHGRNWSCSAVLTRMLTAIRIAREAGEEQQAIPPPAPVVSMGQCQIGPKPEPDFNEMGAWVNSHLPRAPLRQPSEHSAARGSLLLTTRMASLVLDAAP